MNYVPPRRSDGTLQKRRVQLPWPADRPFRVLSIDGGGSSMQFRATFITRAARELSKLFAAYASDERMHDMETD